MHGIETTETMLAFERACRERANLLRLLDHHRLLPAFPATTRELKDPFRLRATIMRGSQSLALNVVPDRVFAIVRADNRPFNFCLETDRGTMSVAARRLTGKSSYARKLTAYFGAWQQGAHRTQWNMQGFRCLSVVPSEKRIQNMLALQRTITGDRGVAVSRARSCGIAREREERGRAAANP